MVGSGEGGRNHGLASDTSGRRPAQCRAPEAGASVLQEYPTAKVYRPDCLDARPLSVLRKP